MGCDGGTIPRRDEMVRMKKKPEKVDKEFELNAKWFHCAITQQELRPPIVSCELGNIYNKESVLEYLLDKSSASTDIAKHIRSLKDVKELKLAPNPAFESKDQTSHSDAQMSRYICPVVGVEMRGRHKFCYLWKCGCVFSERALKEIPSKVCHSCGKQFADEDIVVLNGSEEEVTTMKLRMEERRQKAKLEKKAKRSKAAETVTTTGECSASSSNGDSSPASGLERPNKKLKLDSSSTCSSSTSTSKLPGKVNGASSTLNVKVPELSKYKTVAEDPTASKVYKSLFASGNKERPKHLKSNWVTFRSYNI